MSSISDIPDEANSLREQLLLQNNYKEIQEVALQHLSLRRLVLRIPPKMKYPPPKGWNKAHSSTEWTMEVSFAYWSRSNGNFNTNIALACGEVSGLIVLDIDVKDRGMDVWNEYMLKYEEPDTFSVETPNGGLHFYFKYDDRTEHLLTSSKVLKDENGKIGWDIRSNNGYIITAPSTDERGREYKFRSDSVKVRDIPDWLLKLLPRKR
jgi:hypothetical protein